LFDEQLSNLACSIKSKNSLKAIITLIVLVGIVFWFITCTSQNDSDNDARGSAYAGSATCVTCHNDISNDYVHNGHFKTSSKTEFEAIRRIITAIDDTVHFPGNQFVVLKTADEKASQCYFLNGNLAKQENMDITFGSGEKAMTFGYWKDDKLFELPLTYLSELKRWTNSPGFTENYPSFSRQIIGRCMECHSSYALVQTQMGQRVGQQSEEKIYAQTIVYGIDCERCHGPAAQHVAFQTGHPEVKTAKFITRIGLLTRQRQMDLCATCHSGDPAKLKSIFAFLPGDTLSNYYLYYPGAATNPDAHGMQVQSLMQSQCYIQSDNLTCTSCHDPHKNESNMQTVFIQRCMACHQKSNHAITMLTAKNNCIDCHMPLMASKSLNFNNSAERNDITYKLHTHRIAIYLQKDTVK
jgi:hypothetical protein